MSGAGVVGFYREQARLIWEWRAARLTVVRRTVLAYLCACAALAVAAALVPGFTIHNVGELLLAGLLLTMFNAASRLFFFWLLAPLPIFAVQLASMAFQAAVLIVLTRLISGFQIVDLTSAVVAGLILTVVNALLSELTRAADDDSYYGTLVRQLVARNRNTPRSDVPGILVIQIDGLSLPVLQNQLRAGRMPVLARMLRSGTHTVAGWTALLPSVTPASQAGILHGRNDDIPGFRWYEKQTGHLFVADHPADAAVIVERISDGTGFLSHGGSSIGNLVTGDADHIYLTMATIAADARRLHGFFVSTVNYVRLLVLMVGEFGKELYQAERQRGKCVVPRMHRGFGYALERAIANVALRTVSTALVIEGLYDGDPAVYVDYTGYDTIAHHSGPERQEATDALEGIDRSIGSLLKAIRDTPRPYRVVVLSDHGQSLGTTFKQRFGTTLQSAVASLLGDSARIAGAPDAAGSHAAESLAASPAARPDVVVCSSGNLGLVYLAREPGRLTLETIERLHPGLLAGLAHHPGVGLVMARSDRLGVALLKADTVESLEGPDGPPALLQPYGPTAQAALRRIDGFDNVADLVLLGGVDAERDEIVSFEELVGSHGGLGGWQTAAFLLHPADWTRDAELVGAPVIYRHLRRWREKLQPGTEFAPPA